MALKSSLSLRQYKLLEKEKKIEYAKSLVDLSVSIAAKKFNVIIMVNPVNRASYALLLSGMIPKVKEFTQRTCSAGLFQGYILNEDNYNIPGNYIKLKNRNFYAIRRDDKELWVKKEQIIPTDQKVRALADKRGKYITSDVDILLIANKIALKQEVFFEQDYGFITTDELEIINFINQTYNKLSYKYSLSKSKVSIITHGPYNRHNKSSKDTIRFPIQIFLPNEIKLLGKENEIDKSLTQLKDFALSNKDFYFYIPSHWK